MKILDDYRIIEKFRKTMKGVFPRKDLINLLSQVSRDSNISRRIQRLESEGILQRFTNGFYVTPEFDLQVLSQRIYPDSYISFGTVLSKNLVIGSIPQSQVVAVKVGKKRHYQGLSRSILHLGLASPLFFGFERKNGISLASPEKALIDTLYFHQRGMKFFFDIYSDINLEPLSKKEIYSILKRYQNQKFVKFVKGFLNAT